MTDRPAADDPRYAGADARRGAEHGAEADSMVLHEEELAVGTQRVRTGRVRLRKRVVEEEQTFTVTVRHEEVDLIEEELDETADLRGADLRGADLDGPAEAVDVSDAGRWREGRADGVETGDTEDDTVEIVLYAERPVVTMERVPVERVRLRRVRTREERTVSDQVRREEIEIDRDDLREHGHVDGPDRA